MALVKLKHKVISENEVLSNSKKFLLEMKKRRSVRHFSDRPIPLEAIKNIITTAAMAPSGANKQPWKFVIVQNADVKRKIRQSAEKE